MEERYFVSFFDLVHSFQCHRAQVRLPMFKISLARAHTHTHTHTQTHADPHHKHRRDIPEAYESGNQEAYFEEEPDIVRAGAYVSACFLEANPSFHCTIIELARDQTHEANERSTDTDKYIRSARMHTCTCTVKQMHPHNNSRRSHAHTHICTHPCAQAYSHARTHTRTRPLACANSFNLYSRPFLS